MIIGSVQKAMHILKTISNEQNKPISHSSICQKTGYNKSTCSHILSTLLAEGFIKKTANNRYVIGPETYCLSRYGRYDNDFVTLCHPVMKWLHKKTGHTIILSVVQGGKKFIIDYINENSEIFLQDYEIRPDDLYRTASGRIIMANMDTFEIQNIFHVQGCPNEREWDNINSFDDLLVKIRQIDKKGTTSAYCDIGGGTIHLGYAAAIYRYDQCVAALGVAISCAAAELDDFLNKEPQTSKLLLRARNEIGRRLKITDERNIDIF